MMPLTAPLAVAAFAVALAVTLAVATPAVAASPESPPSPAAPSKPNLVFLLVDDLGWNGFAINQNNTEVKTPNVDQLAQQGVILDRHFVYKFCSPTRASFLTGRVPGHGIWETNPSRTSAIGVNINMTMLPAMLKKGGYKAYHVGKWHQGFFKQEYTPVGRGFDESYAYLGGGEDHFNQCGSCANYIHPPEWSNHSQPCPAPFSPCRVECPMQGGVDLYVNDGPGYGKNGTYNAYAYNEQALDMLKRHKKDHADKPFFFYFAIQNVHLPAEAPPEWIEKYPASDYNRTTIARRVYNAMHSVADSLIGNFTDALKRNGFYDNTIMVVSADNGGTFQHGPPVFGSSNFPLRGHKYSYFEGGIRATAFVHSPLLPQAIRGTRYPGLLQVSDWYPTFCKMAGVDPDDGFDAAPHDGVDAWDMIVNQRATRPASSWASKGGMGEDEVMHGVGGGNAGAYRNGSFKVIVGRQKYWTDGWSAQYPGRTHFIPPPDQRACKEKPCLFHVDADQREMDDLADSQPALLQKMLDRYHALAKLMNVPNSPEPEAQELLGMPRDFEDAGGDEKACDLVRSTGFWQPWVKN